MYAQAPSKRWISNIPATLLLCLAVWACSSDPWSAPEDVDAASADVVMDSRLDVDAGMDTRHDAIPDIVPEVTPDVVTDVEPELVEDIQLPSMPACPQAPPKCNQEAGAGGPVDGVITTIDPTGFRLHDLATWETNLEILQSISSHASAELVDLDTVLQNLDRTATRISTLEDTDCFHTGYTWNVEDSFALHWYPQGIAGTATANDQGTWNGRRLAIVTWYHKPENDLNSDKDKGSKIAIVDLTDMQNIQYRMALLVEPYWNDGVADLKTVPIHAGGLGWYGEFLYIADTSKGFRVFDMRTILQISNSEDDTLGFASVETGYQAFGYKYAIPQVSAYRLTEESCCARFSYAAIDLSTQPPSLLAGEYSADSIAGRVHAWPLNKDTGRLVEIHGTVVSSWAAFPGVKKMQGALTRDDHLFVSSSHDQGIFYHGPIGEELESHPWSYYPEDFTYSAFTDNLWCHTEMPGYRYVFAVKVDKVISGCSD